MSGDRLDQFIAHSIAEGLLPADAVRPCADQRPWPIILLTAFGAWLAAIPLLLVLGMVGGGFLVEGDAPLIVGPIILAASIVLLRWPQVPPFLEQCALPVMLAGAGLLGFGLAEAAGHRVAAAVLAVTAIIVAWLVPRNWLRTLLGAAACALTLAALSSWKMAGNAWWPLHACFAIWLAVRWTSHRLLAALGVATAAAIESIADGWIVVVIAALAYSAGATFLFAAHGGPWNDGHAFDLLDRATQAGSLLLAIAAALVAAYKWSALRQPWSMVVALILAALAWLMPALGAALLLGAVFATSWRWRMAMAAAIAAAWIIGAFYYQLSLPLASKSIIMAGAGAVLAATAWSALRFKRSGGADIRPAAARTGTVGIAVCVLAVLTVANVGIWQKEDLIARGRPIYVELAPVDPRSLMQGDYMRLNFGLMSEGQLSGAHSRERLRIVTRVDARGVARFARLAAGTAPPGAGELIVELTPKEGRYVLASDAWHFKEGEADRWALAKFGEFRVDPSGRVLLVGMRGPKLEPL